MSKPKTNYRTLVFRFFCRYLITLNKKVWTKHKMHLKSKWACTIHKKWVELIWVQWKLSKWKISIFSLSFIFISKNWAVKRKLLSNNVRPRGSLHIYAEYVCSRVFNIEKETNGFVYFFLATGVGDNKYWGS